MVAFVFGPIAKDVLGAAPCVTNGLRVRPHRQGRDRYARCMTKRVPTAAWVHGLIVKDLIGAARCMTKRVPTAA